MPVTAEPLNVTAVVVGVIAAFVFGWLVYSPRTFGRKWAEGSGISAEPPEKMPLAAMLSQVAALACLSLVIGLTATISALWAAIFAILAPALFVVSNGLFLNKSRFALVVDGAYILGAGAIMIIVQGIL